MQQKQISVLALCSSLFMARCKFVLSHHCCSSELSLPEACFHTFVLCKQGLLAIWLVVGKIPVLVSLLCLISSETIIVCFLLYQRYSSFLSRKLVTFCALTLRKNRKPKKIAFLRGNYFFPSFFVY